MARYSGERESESRKVLAAKLCAGSTAAHLGHSARLIILVPVDRRFARRNTVVWARLLLCSRGHLCETRGRPNDSHQRQETHTLHTA